MLQPNTFISPLFGKLIFVIFDVLCGYFIYVMMMAEQTGESRSLLCASVWLFNPLPIAVSSRGNAESIMAFLVLFSLRLFQQNRIILGALIYALSVHVKIYPLTYCFALYLYYSRDVDLSQGRKRLWLCRDNALLVLVASMTFVILTGYCYQK